MSNDASVSANASVSAPECKCKECDKSLSQIQGISTHLDKMYSTINNCNQNIQNQNETLSKVFKEMIPLLKGIDAKLKQLQTSISKLEQ